MGYLVIFLIGLVSGIILMGLCVATSHRDKSDEKRKDIHDAGDKIACYCDKE